MIVDAAGEKVDHEPDTGALAAREAMAGLDVAGIRRFVAGLLTGCGVPVATAAKAMRCSPVQLYRDRRRPDPGS